MHAECPGFVMVSGSVVWWIRSVGDFVVARRAAGSRRCAFAPYEANGTDIKRFSSEGLVPGFPVQDLRIRFGWWGIQKPATQGKPDAAGAVGQKSEVADFGKALGKDMDQESADELV